MMFTQIALAAEELSFPERASTAGIVTLQGMLTIFLVLAILWGAIEIMHHVMHKESKPKKTESTQAPATVEPQASPAPAPVQATETDDGALIAAITAAISAAMAEEGSTGAFRVVSFKRVGKSGSRKF